VNPKNFFAEMKRSYVHKVAVAYAALTENQLSGIMAA
jgi:hypothetical protein